MKYEIIIMAILLVIVVFVITQELSYLHEQIIKIWKMNFDMCVAFDERLKKLENKKKQRKRVNKMSLPKHLMEAKICNKETCAEVEQLTSLVNSCQEEIRRLNNILNELENWLEERSGDISFAYKHTLSKLKELKESDK